MKFLSLIGNMRVKRKISVKVRHFFMKKPVVILVFVVVVAAGVWAYSLLSQKSPKLPEVRLPSEETKKPPQDKNTIIIKDFLFTPNAITVKVGETVTWVNEDGVVHTVKSADFASPNIKNADSYKFQFIKAGTFEYICGVHPYMKGVVIVE